MHRSYRTRQLLLVLCLILAAAPAFAQATQTQKPQPFQPQVGQGGKDVVWVPTPQTLVDKMLDMAGVTSQDFVMDLGSGDGRTVITAAKRGARAMGIEYNPDMVELSKQNAEKAGVTGRAEFVKADLFETDLSKATVITMFLLPDINLRLRPKILDLKPGTRVVSNTFTMEDWNADEIATVGEDCTSWCTALFWIVPAKAGGTWTVPEWRADAHADVSDAGGHDAHRREERAHLRRPPSRRADQFHRWRREVHRQGERHVDGGNGDDRVEHHAVVGHQGEVGGPLNFGRVSLVSDGEGGETPMAEERTWWETIKVEGGELLEKVKSLIREGNVRRIVIRQGERSVAEFPLTVGVVGTVAAPILAAVGALAALLTNCTIQVQRAAPANGAEPPPVPPSEPPDRRRELATSWVRAGCGLSSRPTRPAPSRRASRRGPRIRSERLRPARSRSPTTATGGGTGLW